jgi:hypothetical protein
MKWTYVFSSILALLSLLLALFRNLSWSFSWYEFLEWNGHVMINSFDVFLVQMVFSAQHKVTQVFHQAIIQVELLVQWPQGLELRDSDKH